MGACPITSKVPLIPSVPLQGSKGKDAAQAEVLSNRVAAPRKSSQYRRDCRKAEEATPKETSGLKLGCYYLNLKPKWNALQTEITQCELCRERFPDVDCPPGRIPPEDILPPDQIEVLFIGVAPPKKGCHFYADPKDRLRQGLFKVLKELGRPCEGVHALDFAPFLNNHFYLLHAAKCAIRETSRPSLEVSQFCSNHHLKKEIEALQPEAVCWLSKNVCYPVCRSLSREWGTVGMIPFGKVTSVSIKGGSALFIATKWPGRGGEKDVRAHLGELFRRLKSN
jgi:hypothetical protein